MQALAQSARLKRQARSPLTNLRAIRAITVALVSLFVIAGVANGQPEGLIKTRSLRGAFLVNYISTEGRDLAGDSDYPGKLTVFRREELLVNPASCKTCSADFDNFIAFYIKWRAKKWPDTKESDHIPFVHLILGAAQDGVLDKDRVDEFSVKLLPRGEDLETELVSLGIGLKMPCIVQTSGVVGQEITVPLEYVTCAPTFKQAWEAEHLPTGPVMLARFSGTTFEPRRGRTETLRQVTEGWRENDLFFNRDDAPDQVTISLAFAASLRAAYHGEREYRVIAKFAARPGDFIVDNTYPSNEGSTESCYNLAKNPESCLDEALDIHTHPRGASDGFSPQDVLGATRRAKPMLMVNEKSVYLVLPTDEFARTSPYTFLTIGVQLPLSNILDFAKAREQFPNGDTTQIVVSELAYGLGLIVYRLDGTVFKKNPTTTLSSSFQLEVPSFDKLAEAQKEWVLLLVAVHNARYSVQDWDAWISDPKTIQSAFATTTLLEINGTDRTETPLSNVNLEYLFELAEGEGLIDQNSSTGILLPSRGGTGERESLLSEHRGKQGLVGVAWFHGLVRTGVRSLATASDCDYLGSTVCDYVFSVGPRREVSSPR